VALAFFCRSCRSSRETVELWKHDIEHDHVVVVGFCHAKVASSPLLSDIEGVAGPFAGGPALRDI